MMAKVRGANELTRLGPSVMDVLLGSTIDKKVHP